MRWSDKIEGHMSQLSKRRQRNIALGLFLAFFVLVFYGLGMIRLSHGA